MRAAGALSFSMALAVVPAVALALATLAAFPVYAKVRVTLQDIILRHLMPDTGLKITDSLSAFIASASDLTIFGAVGSLGTAVLLLFTIEGALNEIFHVVRPPPLRKRLVVFAAALTVGPLLLGTGLSLLSYFGGQEVSGEPAGLKAILLGHVMPSVFTWATLAFIFVIIPNRRIVVRDALVGAAVAALLLAALRYTFVLYIQFMTSYQAIYGTVAAVPVFLMWIYLVWIAVLSGAVVAAALRDYRVAHGRVDPANPHVEAIEDEDPPIGPF